MPLFTPDERAFARAVSALGFSNPFLPERIEFEKQALGPEFTDAGQPVWTPSPLAEPSTPNVDRLVERCTAMLESLGERLGGGAKPGKEDLRLYEDLVLFLLYNRYQSLFKEYVTRALDRGGSTAKARFYDAFRRDLDRYFDPTPQIALSQAEGAHLFACFFQIRRAFHLLFQFIVGGSMPAARLRAAAWQSVFTRDMRRFRRVLYDRMGDNTTLITGPSGTGKELVARAIGLSRYIPFEPADRGFTEDFVASFHALNLSALSPTLIESELFGHRRGAFTGAVSDRAGWLEVCRPLGTVFLDEIGEVDLAIQVKLLRVLQTRTFQRLGDTESRRFKGKIIAATNKDMGDEMREGRIREDFYYRLCSDMIVTPSLREQLADSPGELPDLVRYIAHRLIGEDEARPLADEVIEWIENSLGPRYPWPGNVRELEQCVRNVLIRGVYEPPRAREVSLDGAQGLAAEISALSLTAEELLVRYCTLVYARTGNYQETARRLKLDHRTVKSKVDEQLLAELSGGS